MTSDKDFNNQMNTVIAKRFAPDEDVDTKKRYEKMMNLAIIVCVWCLSCVGIYTYWYKYVSNLEYNKLVMDKNTRELDLQMQRYLKASDAYVAIANKGGDSENTGEVKIRRTLYNEMIRTIELFEKCNYIRSMNMGSEYPYAEVIIACVLLSIVCGIVMMSNNREQPIRPTGCEQTDREATDGDSKYGRALERVSHQRRFSRLGFHRAIPEGSSLGNGRLELERCLPLTGRVQTTERHHHGSTKNERNLRRRW